MLIEVACPLDKNVVVTEEEQKEPRYDDLSRQMQQAFKKRVHPISIVIGNTGIVTERCEENLRYIDCDIKMEWLQKIAANETAALVTKLVTGRGPMKIADNIMYSAEQIPGTLTNQCC